MIGSVHCQKLLILERPGTTKYHIYKTGISIRFYDGKSMRMVHGDISLISDTMIVINSLEPFYLSRIAAVYRPLTMLNLLSNRVVIGGIGYFVLTGFNNAINKTSPLVDRGTLVASSVMTGTGVAASFFRYRKFALGTHWRLKVIDMDNPEDRK